MQTDSYIVVTIRLTPNSNQCCVKKWEENCLFAAVTAPPADGSANKMLIKLLSEVFGIPKTDIIILSGHSSRIKRVKLCNLIEDQFLNKLEAYLK